MNGYLQYETARPECPEVRKWVLPEEKKIYINAAAHRDAKIIRIIFAQKQKGE